MSRTSSPPLGSPAWVEYVFSTDPVRNNKGRTKHTQYHEKYVKTMGRRMGGQGRNETCGLLALEYLSTIGLVKRFKEQAFEADIDEFGTAIIPDALAELADKQIVIIELKTERFLTRPKQLVLDDISAAAGRAHRQSAMDQTIERRPDGSIDISDKEWRVIEPVFASRQTLAELGHNLVVPITSVCNVQPQEHSSYSAWTHIWRRMANRNSNPGPKRKPRPDRSNPSGNWAAFELPDHFHTRVDWNFNVGHQLRCSTPESSWLEVFLRELRFKAMVAHLLIHHGQQNGVFSGGRRK